MTGPSKRVTLINFLTTLAGGFLIATGVMGENLECMKENEKYINREKYPENYHKGVWGSGIVILLLGLFMTFIAGKKAFVSGKPMNPSSLVNAAIWCTIINVWLVINASFYMKNSNDCQEEDKNSTEYNANEFFVIYGAICAVLLGFFYLIVYKLLAPHPE